MNFKIIPLTQEKFDEAVNVVLQANLDTKEEIEHHLKHIDAHYVAVLDNKVVGVIGWYQDDVNYATEAMGKDFPGADAYWVGFFAVDKEYRGEKIGKSLMNQLDKVVKENGASKLWVSSVPETESYYHEHSFNLVKKGLINGNQKCFMVKKLI